MCASVNVLWALPPIFGQCAPAYVPFLLYFCDGRCTHVQKIEAANALVSPLSFTGPKIEMVSVANGLGLVKDRDLRTPCRIISFPLVRTYHIKREKEQVLTVRTMRKEICTACTVRTANKWTKGSPQSGASRLLAHGPDSNKFLFYFFFYTFIVRDWTGHTEKR